MLPLKHKVSTEYLAQVQVVGDNLGISPQALGSDYVYHRHPNSQKYTCNITPQKAQYDPFNNSHIIIPSCVKVLL